MYIYIYIHHMRSICYTKNYSAAHLRSSAQKNEEPSYLRYSEPKNEEPFPLTILGFRPAKSKNLPFLRSSVPIIKY